MDGVFDEDKKELKVFPSPASDIINIQNINSDISFSIINISGKIIKEGMLSTKANQIDISSIDNGIYFLVLGKKEVFKILISH